jgi:hypothetical protein
MVCGKVCVTARAEQMMCKHARTPIGIAELPLNLPFAVEVAAVSE